MRSFWHTAPMLRILFALMAGIGLEIGLADVSLASKALLLSVIGLLILAIIAVLAISRVKNIALIYRLRALSGFALTLSIILLGYLVTWLYTETNYPDHFSNFLRNNDVLIVQIDEPPVERPMVMNLIADVKKVSNENGTHKVSGSVMLNLVKDSSSTQLAYGDVILIRSKIQPLDEPKNPGEFNYKRYQGFHNVYYQGYAQASDWRLLKKDQGNFTLACIYRLRDNFLQVIAKYVKDKNDFGVASALMLGYRDYISGDIIRAYSSSGAVHVLSVSGLHVTIMFLMLNFFLKWMDNRGRKLTIAKAVIIICFIWFYACLTGLSPPVLRSALMFTLIQLAQVLFRNKNMYNVVTGSAVVLLLFDPFFLMDVGFQLSYIAVIGIVYLFPKIYPLVQIRNWLLDKIWGLIAVSIAAQIATLPLSLYYFHQFPNLFLISNLVVIPLSEFVLYTGTALFAVAHIPYLNTITGWTFNLLLVLLDKFIFFIDKLPFALIKGISVTLIEMVFIYILLALLCWLTEERKTKVLIASLAIIFGLCSFHSYKTVTDAKQKMIVVYSIPKHRAISFISGSVVQYDFDDSLKKDANALHLNINSHWWNCGVNKEIPVDTGAFQFSFGKLILFEGKRILIVDKDLRRMNAVPQNKLRVDLVIISGNPNLYIDQLRKLVDFNELVFDSSNKPARIKYWGRDAEQFHIAYWDVKERGAYLKNI